MATRWIEALTGSFEGKKAYKQDKARIDGLPEPYAGAAQAVHRYLLIYPGFTDGDTHVTMLGDLADLWEQAAADATPIRAIVGDDPVEFAETFARAYSGTEWIDKERRRLTDAIDQAEEAEPHS